MKKILTSMLVIVLLFMTVLNKSEKATAANATKEIHVSLNGTEVQFDVKPQYIGDRTYVPFRKLLEALGAYVTWDDSKQIATAVKDGITITIPLGSQSITVQGHDLQMDVPVVMVNDRTLIPLRFVAQALGAKVDWNAGESEDFVSIAQSYEVMINRLVDGASAEGDQKVTYEQAEILFEWLEKGKEKQELPNFTASLPIDNEELLAVGDGVSQFWNQINSKYYSKDSRRLLRAMEIYTDSYRLLKYDLKQDGKSIAVFYIVGDQRLNHFEKSQGKDVAHYLPF